VPVSCCASGLVGSKHDDENCQSVAGALLLAGVASAQAADITGKVTLKGTPPPEKALPLDPACGKLWPNEKPKTRFYAVGADSGLADVFVYLKKVRRLRRRRRPSRRLLDQKGCEYVPYVLGLQTGQKLLVRNSDPCCTTCTPRRRSTRSSTWPRWPAARTSSAPFDQPEVFVRFKCDVHPWMFAYVGVVSAPVPRGDRQGRQVQDRGRSGRQVHAGRVPPQDARHRGQGRDPGDHRGGRGRDRELHGRSRGASNPAPAARDPALRSADTHSALTRTAGVTPRRFLFCDGHFPDPNPPGSAGSPWFTAVATLGLIALGGLVTSHGAGMAVPDWPTTYGYNMFLFPISQWVGGIFYEHTHRLYASGVGLLTVVLAVVAPAAGSGSRRLARLGWAGRGLGRGPGLAGRAPRQPDEGPDRGLHAALAQAFLVLLS
jgi:hypothetical protein